MSRPQHMRDQVFSGQRPLFYVMLGLALVLAGNAALHGEALAPGVTYTPYSAPGPNNVYVVAVDRLRSEYKLEIGYAQGKRNYTARERTSQIAARYENLPSRDVLSAINASYFDTATVPRLLGVGQANGEMLDTPGFNSSYTYHTMMVGASRRPTVVTNFNHVQGVLKFADGYSIPLSQYNFYMNGPLVPINGVAAFTPSFDSSTRSSFITPSIAVEVALTNVSYPMRSDKEVSGIVSAIYSPTSGNAAIPAGGMVLSAWGSTKTDIVTHTHSGDRLRMSFASTAEDYNISDNAVTGIGWIIHNGAAYPAGWSNLESGAAPYSRNPRSVLAWNDSTWFQVVCDGRTTASVGMTFQEMANFLVGTLGATEAVNYDGGGSATMVANGTVRNVPSDGSERAVANAILLVKRDTSTVLPFSDPFGPSGRTSGWDDKFHYNDAVAFSPASPGGDGYVLKVLNPAGPVETTRAGDFGDSDYSVRAQVYCEYRPGDAVDGYERYALFARDSGTGALGLTNYGGGNCYALTYDSDSGRVRAAKYVNGSLNDFLEASPLYMPSTAWRLFRIDCQGSTIRYFVDTTQIASVSDSTFVRGYFGVGAHESFATSSNAHGTRADSLSVTAIGAKPTKAVAPAPGDQSLYVSLAPELSWSPGLAADSHGIYFGPTSPGIFRGNQGGSSFSPGSLAPGTTYYWRVDEVNDNGTTTGDVWSFTTRYMGDMDVDGDVDLEDFGALQLCLSGSLPQTDPGCTSAHLAGTSQVNENDVVIFIDCLSGPGVPTDLSCLSGH